MKKVKCKLCEGTGYMEKQTLKDKIITLMIVFISISIVFLFYSAFIIISKSIFQF
jgi:hypothetical protein